MRNQCAFTAIAGAALLLFSAYARALPAGAQVVNGNVAVTSPSADRMNINQGSDKAIINWNSFSIQQGERVDVKQLSSSSVLLNRVTGGDISTIAGRLTATGKVFLVNPQGVVFAPGARVDVGSLVASTLGIADADFLAGRYHFSSPTGQAPARVDNQGRLFAHQNGAIVMLGGTVNNDGTVVAKLGTAALVAGSDVTLDFAGDGLTAVKIDRGALQAAIVNDGKIDADGGLVLLSAQSADALAGTVINQKGMVRARSIAEHGGRIVLDGGDAGITQVSGRLDASGMGGAPGGRIDVTGHDVALLDGARIEANGDASTANGAAGGQVRIGGGAAGAEPDIRNAQAVWISPHAEVNTNANQRGKGGRIVVFGTDAARVYGKLSARGGRDSGDGGQVETSAHFLDVSSARVLADAAHGSPGAWLLDPFDLDIVDKADGEIPPDSSQPPTVLFTSSAQRSQVSASTLDKLLSSGTSVTLRTGAGDTDQKGDINIEAPIEKSANGAPSDVTLEFDAIGGIYDKGQSISADKGAGALNVVFNSINGDAAAGKPGVTLAGMQLVTNGGNVSMHAPAAVITGTTIDTRVVGAPQSGHGGVSVATFGPSGIGIQGGAIETSGPIGLSAGGAGAAVRLMSTTLDSNGGDVSIAAPAVVLERAKLDTTVTGKPAAPGGAVSIVAAGAPNATIIMNESSIRTTTGSIDMTANGGGLIIASRNADGRVSDVTSTLITTTGDIRLDGATNADINRGLAPFSIATRGGAAFPAYAAGVLIDGAKINTAGGKVDIRGSATAPRTSTVLYGVALNGASIATLGGPLATIAISGQTTTSAGGIYARSTTIGSPAEQGDVILRALNEGKAPSLDLTNPPAAASPGLAATAPAQQSGTNRFTTLNSLVVVPGGVDAAHGFTLTTADAIPITLGAYTGGMSLTQAGLDQLSGAGTLVFGSDTHTGAITIAKGTSFSTNLTLANAGSQSKGIAAPGGIATPGKTLTLVSAGPVAIAGPVAAYALMLAGPGSFDLHNPANMVNVLAASGAGDVIFMNTGALTIGSMLSPTYYTGAGNVLGQVAMIDATDTTVLGNMVVTTGSGGIRLGGGTAQQVGPTGAADTNITAGGNIDLVMDGSGAFFTNAGKGQLMAGPGRAWHVWADTWVGESRGPIVPGGTYSNFYGCTYSGGCTWGGVVDLASSHFIYAARPTATVTIADQSRAAGAVNPSFAFNVDGLVNEDSQNNALRGEPTTPAGTDALAGTYPIAGTFTSPVGYIVTVKPGTLTVTARETGGPIPGANNGGAGPRGNVTGDPPASADPPILDLFGQTGLQSVYSDSEKSFIYETNLDGLATRSGASACSGSNQPLESNLTSDASTDELAIEWRRVRSQPNLNNCIVVNRQHGCADF